MRRRLTFTVACGLIALVVTGCSGSDSNEAAPTGSGATTGATGTTATGSEPAPSPAHGGEADPAPGRVLLRFVKAAGRNDAAGMWRLLSAPTQATIGPTLDDFRAGAAQDFTRGLGSLAPSAKVILSRKLGSDWSVAAVSGEQTSGGKAERYSYGAALVPEGRALKLELGGVVVTRYKPPPLAEVSDPQPVVGANVGAGGDLTDVRLWLDGKPLPFERGANDSPFTATMRGMPARPLDPGEHQVVVFAATDATATASAWPFTVKK
jgi:hypothetical protein